MNGNWQIEYTDEFYSWWMELTEAVQDRCAAVVDMLEREGPTLRFPYSSEIVGSKIALRELRIQCCGHPYDSLCV